MFVLGAGAALARIDPNYGTGRGFESIAIAHSLAQRWEFADPYSAMATGATAHLPPLYPALMAALMWFLGDGYAFRAVLMATGVAAHGLLFALLPRMAWMLFGSVVPGYFAVALGLVLHVYSLIAQWENTWAAVVTLSFCMISRAAFSEKPRLWTAAGALAGLEVLLNPVCAVVMAAWLLSIASHRHPKRLAGVILLATAITTPWLVRNRLQLGKWVFVRGNFGMELWVNNVAPSRNFHPNVNAAEAAKIRELGEAAYNELRLEEAVRDIRGAPSRFLSKVGSRILQFWFPADRPPVWAATVLTVISLLILMRSHRQVTAFTAVAVTLYPIPYYIIMIENRYRDGIMWICLLCSGYLTSLVVARASSRVPKLQRTRLQTG